MPGTILIIGASSGMAQEAARIWAKRGARLVLCGRNPTVLDEIEGRLRRDGAADVWTLTLDACHPTVMAGLVERAAELAGAIDAVLIAQGSLTDEGRARTDAAYLADEITVNLTAVAIAAEAAVSYLQWRGGGVVAVIGSVAGDRGKARNYLYGMTKAALEIQMQGLRGRLIGSGVRAVLIKPGPTDTKMTADHPKSALFSSADRVGRDIVRAIDGGPQTVYAPWWWRWVMLALKALPEAVFLRLKI